MHAVLHWALLLLQLACRDLHAACVAAVGASHLTAVALSLLALGTVHLACRRCSMRSCTVLFMLVLAAGNCFVEKLLHTLAMALASSMS